MSGVDHPSQQSASGDLFGDLDPSANSSGPIGPVRKLDERERYHWIRLSRCDGVGPATFVALLDRFGSPAAALDALPELVKSAPQLARLRLPDDRALEQELEIAARLNAWYTALCEPNYPAWLRAIDTAPPVLMLAGRTDLVPRRAVAIVGARQASAAGKRMATTLAHDLGAAGCVVVSGLARGIDAAAHHASIETGTIAVVAGGLDVIYPPEHQALHERLLNDGLIVAERGPGSEPRAKDFPRRNRIISGLCPAVIVVEAARRSGSLTTARFAAEQGRDVFAFPGHPLDPRASGTLHLLREGASLCTHADDVLNALNTIWEPPRRVVSGPDPVQRHWASEDRHATGFSAQPLTAAPQLPPEGLSETTPEPASVADRASDQPIPSLEPTSQVATETIRSSLGPTPISVDDLCRATGLAPRDVQVALMELDLAGELQRHGQQMVSRLTP